MLVRARLIGAATLCAGALAFTGCAGAPGANGSGGASSVTAHDVGHVTPPARVSMSPSPDKRVRWSAHPTLLATHGTIASVRVVPRAGGSAVSGLLGQHGERWRVTSRLTPNTRYRATVRLLDAAGHPATRHLSFRTTPATNTLSMSATPGDGWTRGVGETLQVSFNRPVSARAALEKHMFVTDSSGKRVHGGWHWYSDTVAHFRPRHFWPANSTFTAHVDLQDVYVGHGVWGDRNHDWSWHTSNAHISYVNADTHRFRVTVNGRQIADWPTGMGQPGFETRDGVYRVLMKTHQTEMDSCSVGLGCTKSSPTYYDLQVKWDVRLTDSGTFVHAAPWDSQLGAANTSHGCIHLSTANATRFYEMSEPGDIVIVRGTGRAANPDDPGMMDWNIPWSQWAN
ncbi:L,D-transpeptidase [Nocardioides terrisoli]|uniref:L,D-transpeptidase n=1 Tax=Nocardioides terrisoli TaxID=3388267 RepID=UPI00287B7079|nr:Ig-like domain-containing protein [Nocardioides marmorisolisilvae]